MAGRKRSKVVWEHDCLDCGRSFDRPSRFLNCWVATCGSLNIVSRLRPTLNIDDLWGSNKESHIFDGPEFPIVGIMNDYAY